MGAFLLVGLLVCATTGTQAACVASPDHPYEGEQELGACKTCSEDNSTCVQCWGRYSLASNGTCVQCTADNCNNCDGNNPDVCYDCTFYWDEAPETGYYADDSGKCVECLAKKCTFCHNGNGSCYQCNSQMGLTKDNTCKECTDQEDCLRCDGNQAACDECSRGYYISPEAKCVACPKDCGKCTLDGKTCLECERFMEGDFDLGVYLDAADGQCKTCLAGCFACSGPNTCEACASVGWTDTTDGRCTKCTDPHCTTCAPENPDQCQICASFNDNGQLEWGADNSTGRCVKCKIKHCASCQTDADSCDYCKDGWILDDVDKPTACNTCTPHCSSCFWDVTNPNNTMISCSLCKDGYEMDYETTNVCKKSS